MRRLMLISLIALLMLITMADLLISAQEIPSTPYPVEMVTVVKVLNGDSIEVNWGGGTRRVRYIGINANETCSSEATTANAALVSGRVVALHEISSSEVVDSHGNDAESEAQLWRYVYVDGVFVNAELVFQGWAGPAADQANVAFTDLFRRLEIEARFAQRGCHRPHATPLSTSIPLSTATPLSAATPEVVWVTPIDDYANLRLGPGMNYASEGRLEAGQQIKAIARNAASETWLQLEGGYWAAKWVLMVSGDDTALPTSLPDVYVKPKEDSKDNYANLRVGPDEDCDKVGILTLGEWAKVTARNDTGWLKLENNSWVFSGVVETSGNVNSLPVRTDLPAVMVRPKEGGQGNIDLRIGPGEHHIIIDSLTQGTEEKAVAQNTTGEWVMLEHYRWIPVSDVIVEGNLNTLPVCDFSPQVEVKPGNLEYLILYAGPSHTAEILSQVGGSAKAIALTTNKDWLMLEDGSWVSLATVRVDDRDKRDLSLLPFFTIQKAQ